MGILIIDQKQRVANWVAKRINHPFPFAGYYAMGVERNGELVSGVVIEHFNGRNAYAHMAIDKTGKDMILLLRAVADYAFRQCGLKRLSSMVKASNTKALKFDDHIGWKFEFLQPDGAADGDMVFLVMWAHECPWLNSRGKHDPKPI